MMVQTSVFLEAVFYFGGSLLLLATVLWLLVTVYLYLLHRKYAHIPSPEMPSFYMGHIPAIAKIRKAGRLFGDLVLEWGQECGPLYVIFFTYVPAVVVLKPDDIKEVLMNVKVAKSAAGYKAIGQPFGQRFLGRGLVTLPDYNSWKPRRSLYDPSFTKSYLRSLIPSFNECVEHFLKRMRIKAIRERTVLMRKEMGAVTLQILGKVAFGSDFSQSWSDKSLGLKYAKGNGTLGFLVDHSFEGVEMNMRNPLHFLFHPYCTEGYRESIRAMRKIGQDCITQRFKAIANREEVPNDILTQIVRVASSDRGVYLEDLVDDFVTFYIAGQETTALMLTFTLIELSRHPEVKQRVLDEISEILGDRDFVTAEDIEQLQYMEQVFLEVLRLYPPAIGTSRESPSDDFKISGYAIPKETMIMMSFYANQRNPDHWEDPETFDPSRFSPARGKPSPFIFSPFSTGHRSCIGKVFAIMEGKIILARLLNSFKVTLREGYQLKLELTTTLRPADYVPCTVAALK